MLVFLDFEASSLNKESYPIEVGWVFETGEGENHLIRPAPDWTDWDESAAAVHGITRSRLFEDGEPHDAVCRQLVDKLSGHRLFASAPSWDGKWLSVLLRASGYPRHLLRLNKSDEAFAELAGGDMELIATARKMVEQRQVEHRALADARRELAIWLEIGRLEGEAQS